MKFIFVPLLGMFLLTSFGCSQTKTLEEQAALYKTIEFDENTRPKLDWNPNHVIFTFYFTGNIDTQRATAWANNNFDMIRPWHVSMEWQKLHGVVFHDNLDQSFVEEHTTQNIEFIKVKAHPRFDIYTDRFLLVLDYLEKHPEIEFAFLTDGSDVVVRMNPFENIQKDLLYVGSEQATIANKWDWLANQAKPFFNEDQERAEQFRNAHGSKTLLNAGISGGHRGIYLEFLAEMKRMSELSDGSKSKTVDMAAFNFLLYSDTFAKRFITGAPVHSPYKNWEIGRNDVYFVHK